jgi:UDP-glucose 4-epimerase
MRILITGGFGFIGGRLAQHLLQSGQQVVLGSRKSSNPPDWLPAAVTVQTNWSNGDALEEICDGVDVIIHGAGMAAQDCAANPVAALELNAMATARLLKAAVARKVRRFIYLSTAHVYASPLVGVITERTCPRNLHPYATSHRAGEDVVLGAGCRGLIDGVVLRLSNVFGAPADKAANCWGLLVNDLCKQALSTGRIVLNSSGLQQRDFLPMTDACRAIEHIALGEIPMFAPLLNVGAGKSQSVIEISQLVQRRCNQLLGYDLDLECAAVNADEKHQSLQYRVSKLKKTGFCAALDHSGEIDKLLLFCKANYF